MLKRKKDKVYNYKRRPDLIGGKFDSFTPYAFYFETTIQEVTVYNKCCFVEIGKNNAFRLSKNVKNNCDEYFT